jgi:hypothetical protein
MNMQSVDADADLLVVAVNDGILYKGGSQTRAGFRLL